MVRGNENVGYNQNLMFMYKQRHLELKKGVIDRNVSCLEGSHSRKKASPEKSSANLTDSVLADKTNLKGEMDWILAKSEKRLKPLINKSQIIVANHRLNKKNRGKDAYLKDYEPKYVYLNQSNTKNHGSYLNPTKKIHKGYFFFPKKPDWPGMHAIEPKGNKFVNSYSEVRAIPGLWDEDLLGESLKVVAMHP